MQYILTQEEIDQMKEGFSQEIENLNQDKEKLKQRIDDIKDQGKRVLGGLPMIRSVGQNSFIGTESMDPRYEMVKVWLEELTGIKQEDAPKPKPFNY